MGNTVVSYGNRHVRIWKPDDASSPKKPRAALDNSMSTTVTTGPKILQGQNSILGDLLDDNFHCAVAVSDFELVLATSKGNICLLDESARPPRLQAVAQVPAAVQCLCYDADSKIVWAAGQGAVLQPLALQDLRNGNELQADLSLRISEPRDAVVAAIGKIRGCILTIEDRQMHITDARQAVAVINKETTIKSFPAHDSAVLGVCSLVGWSDSSKYSFLTYSARGSVLFWRFDGTCTARFDVPLDQMVGSTEIEANELKSLAVFEATENLIVGDKTGILQ